MFFWEEEGSKLWMEATPSVPMVPKTRLEWHN